MFLSIIIPAYNEARRLPQTLKVLAAYCETLPFESEIIAVIEKSTDETVSAASFIAAAIPSITLVANEVKRGKGYALRTGVARARGEIVFTMDADMSVPAEYLRAFIEEFKNDPAVQVLVGNRQHSESLIGVRQSWLRETLGKGFNLLVRLVSASALPDTQCGFKAFRRDAAMAIFSRQTVDGFACDVEILMLASRMGFAVRDLPVRWDNSPDSRVKMVRDSIRMLIDLFLIRGRVEKTLAQRPYLKTDAQSG